MTYVGHALAYAILPAENWTKFSSCSGTSRFKQLSDTSDALQQQLGLKLEATKGPADFIVIDHAEKPSAN